MTTLTTARLTLRPFRLTDASAMDHLFGDPEVMRFGPGLQNPQWVRDWLRFRILEFKEEAKTNVWAVERTLHPVVLGYCGLFYYPELLGSPETEIGYRLIRSYWGQGYATEAAIAVCDYAFKQLGLSRLVAMIDPDNLASIRVAEKLGMTYERDVMLAGYSHPDYLYVLESE
jgi:ribosomal-protein-alanine N-acetyltransferase